MSPVPHAVETYDWNAAKARVVKILAEFGEELPQWEEGKWGF